MSGIVWPKKLSELRTAKFDSSVWNDFRFRSSDVIIATYEKAGTTWAQQIVAQLVFGSRDDLLLHEISPWLDLRSPAKGATLAMLEAQQHRRIIKTHLPLHAMIYVPDARYIYVGRDGRDVAWSLHHHLRAYTRSYIDQINQLPGRVGPPLEKPQGSEREFLLQWLREDGAPIGSFWEHVSGWWGIRHLPNLLLLHYAELKMDLPGQIRRVADFLGVEVDGSRWPAILEHCGFDYMKRNAEKFAPRGGANFEGGAQSFINQGTNGRWSDVLNTAEIAEYEETAIQRLGSTCADWLRGHPMRDTHR